MSSEYQPQFENDLAAAAQPTEIEDKIVENINDPAGSLQQGLIKLYIKYLSLIDRRREVGLIDSEKASELGDKILALAKRDGLRNELKYTPTEEAREIMGEGMYFGPHEVTNAGIEIREEVPPIPFDPEELEKAKELGQMLIYRTDTTFKELYETVPQKLFPNGLKLNIGDGSNMHKAEHYYHSDRIQPGWALVSKDLIPGSTNKNYLEQTESLAEYLVNEVFQDKPLPSEYQVAIDELSSQKDTIRQLIESDLLIDRQQAGKMLASLKINQLLRHTPAEVIYDLFVYFEYSRSQLYFNGLIATSDKSNMENILIVGWNHITNIRLIKVSADADGDLVGTAFTRRL